MSGVEGVGKTPQVTNVGAGDLSQPGLAGVGEEGVTPNPMNAMKTATAAAGQEESAEKIMKEMVTMMTVRDTEGRGQRSRQRIKEEKARAGLK